MKLLNSFLLAAVSADEESRKIREKCNENVQEKLKEYPVSRGEWKCEEGGKKDSVICKVVCDGNGIVYDWYGYGDAKWREARPQLRVQHCSRSEYASWSGKKRWLSNPINCVDMSIGQDLCESRAAEVLSRQTDSVNWSCSLSVKWQTYTCRLNCPSRSWLVPKSTSWFTGFRFSQCHTENPQLTFYGMNDGDDFTCENCDEKLAKLSSEVLDGSFVKTKTSKYGDFNYYDVKCDDGRVEARYKCSNGSGYLRKISKKATTWEDQPCSKGQNGTTTMTTTTTTTTTVASQETCDVYIRGESHEDYDTAVSTCEDMDAYLFYAKSFPELNTFVSLRPQRSEWYGIKRESRYSSTWITSDGGTSSYKLWNYGEPNNVGSNEGCAEIKMASYNGRYLNDIPCDSSKPFTCYKTVAVGTEYIDGDDTCTCTTTGVECAPSYSCTYDSKTVTAGEVVTGDNTVCECTESGMQCESLTECPEFIKMEGEKTYAEAEAECAELGGFVAFFKDESEHEKYINEDVTRKEWMGLERVNGHSNDQAWRSADGGTEFFTNWARGEPNGGWSEPCAEIYMGGATNGQMNDVRCHYKRQFSCRVSVQTRGNCS